MASCILSNSISLVFLCLDSYIVSEPEHDHVILNPSLTMSCNAEVNLAFDLYSFLALPTMRFPTEELLQYLKLWRRMSVYKYSSKYDNRYVIGNVLIGT